MSKKAKHAFIVTTAFGACLMTMGALSQHFALLFFGGLIIILAVAVFRAWGTDEELTKNEDDEGSRYEEMKEEKALKGYVE